MFEPVLKNNMFRALSAIFLLLCLMNTAQAAIAFRAASSIGQASGGTITVAKPAGTVSGVVMLASVTVVTDVSTVAGPAGWTLVLSTDQTSTNTSRLYTYYKVAGAAEPASYDWTVSGTNIGAVAAIASFSGVNNITPIDASAGQATPSSLLHTAPSVTATVTGDMLVTVHEFASARTWTPPTGMTEIVDSASRPLNKNGVSMEMNYLLLAVTGVTGTQTATASANADTGAAHAIALRPVIVLDHIEIDYPAPPFSTCTPTTVSVLACANAACSSYYTSGVSVTLSPGSNVVSIPSGSGSASGTVYQTLAGAATLDAVSVPPELTATTCKNTSASTFSCSVTFSATSLAVSVPNLVSGNAVTGTISGCTAQLPTGANTINFYTTYQNPASGSKQATINATTVAIVSPGTAISLNFNGASPSSSASFSLSYPDVGGVGLTAVKGSASGSASFVAVPDRFTLSNIMCGNGTTYTGCIVISPYANPGAANAGGVAFMKAGNPFSMTVTAYNSAGVVTPNFGQETIKESVALTPVANMPDLAGAVAGSLTGSFGAFSSGVASGTAFVYNEAGIMTVTTRLYDPDAKGYLSIGNQLLNPAGTVSVNIGRFTPDHFTLNTNALNPILARAGLPQTTALTTGTTAPATVINVGSTAGFYVGSKVRIPGAGVGGNTFTATVTAVNAAGLTLTLNTAISTTLLSGDIVIKEWGSYMGERMDAQFTLNAVALAGTTTTNYQGVYAKLNPAAATNPLGFGAVDMVAPTYNLALDTSLAATGSFSIVGSAGSATIVAPLVVTRGATAVGPYNSVQIGIAPTDSDSVKMGGGVPCCDYNLGVSSSTPDHTSIMDPLVQNVTGVRYGRMKISNAYGSELLSMPVASTAQYWNVTAYVTNTNDNETVLAITDIVLNNYQRKTGDTWTTSVILPNTTPSGGVWAAKLSKPAGTFSGGGSVDMSIPSLTGASCSVVPIPLGCYLPSSTGRGTFGVYKGSNIFIYQREN